MKLMERVKHEINEFCKRFSLHGYVGILWTFKTFNFSAYIRKQYRLEHLSKNIWREDAFCSSLKINI